MLRAYTTLARVRKVNNTMATIKPPTTSLAHPRITAIKAQSINQIDQTATAAITTAAITTAAATKPVQPLNIPSSPSSSRSTSRRPRKDVLKDGDPATDRYFKIRRGCTSKNDNVELLRELLPKREVDGKDWAVWPRQHLLLHGLTKAGCVECVKYLINTLQIDVNSVRPTDKCTPLHMAHYHLQGKKLQTMRKTLLRLKAKPHLRNKWGERPADVAAKPTEAEPSPKMSPASPQQSPCAVADMWLDAPEDGPTALSLGPSAESTAPLPAVARTLAPLPAHCVESPAFEPKGDATYRSFCLNRDIALQARDPRACAWQPAGTSTKVPATKQPSTPAAELYAAARRAAGALLPAHSCTESASDPTVVRVLTAEV